ncbi:hypothetical protein [Actinomyces procaprae]|uniref:hypothetical protein n=1 Tax=Actinomyces procaprae TaxID=2560010 RepID=UPI0010A2687E|nr:hypothetical protein [Actinomyces procaprae]
MSTRIDWSQGPIPCKSCGRPMRPARTKTADWPGTVVCRRDGLCHACVEKARRKAETGAPGPQVSVPHRNPAALAARGGARLSWERAIPGGGEIPLAHWEAEALGAVAKRARELRLILCGRPDMTVVHGRTPRIRAVARVRPMTDTEAATIARHGMRVGEAA